jgi:hypothetical protein
MFGRKEEYSLGWDGMLTIDNIENVVKLLEKLLTGKKYTFVTSNEFFRYEPEVRASQRKSGKINFWKEKDYAGFNVADTYGVWGCSTNAKIEQYDHTFQNPYFVFEWNKVKIIHRAPVGHLLYWLIAVEE